MVSYVLVALHLHMKQAWNVIMYVRVCVCVYVCVVCACIVLFEKAK